jgi:uncharacterized protein (TIGR02996 family)
MARNPELEALIAKSPDDPSNYLVYADWLMQQNDPWGELISLQTRHETDKDPSQAERAQTLHDQNNTTWLGELAGAEGFACTWRRGYLDEVTLGNDDTPDISHEDLYKKLRPFPVAQLIRSINFAAFSDDDGEPTWDGGVNAMLEYGVPTTVRRLCFDRGNYWDISSTYLNKLEPIYARLPNLEVLDIRLGHMDLGKITLPNLREFSVYTGGFDTSNMTSVLEATWPKLERLVLRFGGNEDYGGTCEAEHVLPLLSQSHPHLKHLALANSAFIDALIPQLAKSPLLKQLESLDLSLGMMTDAGANQIVENAAAFKHLKHLDVHRNYLSKDACAALATVCASVDVTRQEDVEDDYRYCQIGE